MTASTNHKKRARSPLNDCEECLPISKRINRLQIQSERQMNVNIVDGANQVEAPYVRSDSYPEDLHRQCRNMRIHSNPLSPSSPSEFNQNGVNFYGHSASSSNASSSSGMSSNMAEGQSTCLQYDNEKVYEPELDQADNPYYFNINKLLFEAHVDRVVRVKSKFPDS